MKELDLDNDDEFREFCKEQGEDYDLLHAAAGKHFTSPVRTPWTGPLTPEQQKAMAEEDCHETMEPEKPFVVHPFDFKKIQAQMRTYCEEQGEDYDELCKRVSLHPAFRNDALTNPRKFTDEEHKAMLDFINNDDIFGF